MNKYRKNVTSQNGEDGVIEQIFKIINMAEVKILIQGYISVDSIEEGQEVTCPTITLVKDKDIIMESGIKDAIKKKIDKKIINF